MQWPLLGYCHDGIEHCHGYLSWYRDTAEPRAEVVWQHLPKQQAISEKNLHFRVATYNVCTIAEKRGAVGIQALLRSQFAAQKLDIIGLQESSRLHRSSKQQITHGIVSQQRTMAAGALKYGLPHKVS